MLDADKHEDVEQRKNIMADGVDVNPKFPNVTLEAIEKTIADKVAEAQKQTLAAIDERMVKLSPPKPGTEEEKFLSGQVFGNWSNFLKDVAVKAINGKPPTRLAEYEHAVEERAIQGHNETTAGDGGVLIPAPMSPEVLKSDLPDEIVYPRARKIQMATNNLKIPYLVDKDRSGGLVRNAIQHTIVGEGDALTPSKLAFNKLDMTCYKLGVLAYTTREVIEDSPISLESLITTSMVEELANARDYYFINGSNSGQMMGAINASNPALVTVTRASATDISYDDTTQMYEKMPVKMRAKAVWLAGPDTYHSLSKMTVSSVPVWLGPNSGNTNSNAVYAPVMMLHGSPIIFTDEAAALGGDGDLSYVNFSAYYIGERAGIISDRSIHVEFLTDQTAYRLLQRIDGRGGWYTHLTDKKSVTHSPFVKLVT